MAEGLWEQVNRVEPQVIAWRRDIHAHPEGGFVEFRTARLVADCLSALGLSVRTGVARTGVVADLEAPGKSTRVALRADMDALELTETAETEYRSNTPGLMHACGHDAHTAMLLGVATVLSRMRQSLAHSVRFVFQPAEEHPPGGAVAMVEAGVLEGVNEIYAIHVDSALEAGIFSANAGVAMASTDEFHVVIEGRGGHAASPHLTHDPIVASAGVILALQTIASRRVDPIDPVVLSICQVKAGTAFNIIPEEVSLCGTVRTLKTETRRQIPKLMEETILGVAAGYGCRATVDFHEQYPVTVNDPRAVERVRTAAARLFPDAPHFRRSDPRMGAEDFSYYVQNVPGALVWLGVKNADKGIVHPHHHPRFDLDEAALKNGVALLAQLTLS